jgi:hypothetical protein
VQRSVYFRARLRIWAVTESTSLGPLTAPLVCCSASPQRRQLVQASNGVSLWTESYDRQLTSVFATQENIAQAVTVALKVPLGLHESESLVRSRTKDEAMITCGPRCSGEPLSEAAALLKHVIARDPDFALARALPGDALSFVPRYTKDADKGDSCRVGPGNFTPSRSQIRT